MKRTDFYIIINTESGKKLVKVSGYMFEKCGHWFTVRHRNPKVPGDGRYAKWIISDFVTGLILTSTDSRLEHVRYALPECSIVKLLGLYDNSKEKLQSYADMIHAAMFKYNSEYKMLELHQSQAEKLFN